MYSSEFFNQMLDRVSEMFERSLALGLYFWKLVRFQRQLFKPLNHPIKIFNLNNKTRIWFKARIQTLE